MAQAQTHTMMVVAIERMSNGMKYGYRMTAEGPLLTLDRAEIVFDSIPDLRVGTKIRITVEEVTE